MYGTSDAAHCVLACVCVCVCGGVCVCVPRCIPTLSHGPGCNLGQWWGFPLVVDYWAGLQSVHGFRCYYNIAPNAKCKRVLVLALCLVSVLFSVCKKRHIYI